MAVPGMTHNPQRIIELLRDHLAAHDKRMLFLFGGHLQRRQCRSVATQRHQAQPHTIDPGDR